MPINSNDLEESLLSFNEPYSLLRFENSDSFFSIESFTNPITIEGSSILTIDMIQNAVNSLTGLTHFHRENQMVAGIFGYQFPTSTIVPGKWHTIEFDEEYV